MAATDLRELLRLRVERGASLLDSVEPCWWQRVTASLDLSSCEQCVLGQVYGGFGEGACTLFANGDAHEAAVFHGFSAGKPEVSTGFAFETLNDLWLEAIANRRLAP